jgi:hypothetical protein
MPYVNKAKVDQPLPFKPGRRRILDEDFSRLAFEAVMEGGTFERARRILTEQGEVNKLTGKPYTYMGVYLASYRYLLENHEELKPRLFKKWKEQSDIVTSEDDWNKFIIHKAMMVLGNSSTKRFMDWLDKNPWAKEYDYLYAKSFGLRQTSSG